MNKIIPSFTSQRSRLSKEKIDIVKSDILPKYEISSFHEVSTFQNVNIEIGSGYGYTIVYLAKNNPEKNFIACEVYIDAISSMCKKITAEGLENVRVYVNDARLLFEHIPDGFLENIYVLFPDPWPKKKHHKRRIISVDFLKEAKRILQNGGKCFIATDHDSYKEHICDVIHNQNFLQWQANTPENFTQEPQWWVRTKYQEKAILEGRSSVFFTLEKPVKEE
jgi:tRNA (guanine-N7-)-methyltransferase